MRRPTALTLCILVVAAGTLLGMSVALLQAERFAHAFPGAGELGRCLFLACAALILVGLHGLWHQRRSALWLLAAATVASFILNIHARAPLAHTLSGLGAAVALAWSSRSLWWGRTPRPPD